MKNLWMARCSLAVLTLFLSGASSANVDEARTKGLAWLLKQQTGDGSFSSLNDLQVQATSLAAQAMLRGGMQRSPANIRAIAWLSNAPASSMDARAAQVSALAAAGHDALGMAALVRDERIRINYVSGAPITFAATWGAYADHGSSIADTALGYRSLRLAGATYSNDLFELTATALCQVVTSQLTQVPWNGAWPTGLHQVAPSPSEGVGSLLSTATMLQELKEQRQANRFLGGTACGKSSPSDIDAAIGGAKAWLLAQSNTDGGFADRRADNGQLDSSSVMATVLAIKALTPFANEGDATASSRISNARAWLLTQQQTNGSWRANPFLTAAVLSALPEATGAQVADIDEDGLPDVVEQVLGTQVAVSDAQGTLATNANAVAGVTTAAFAASGVVGQSFSYDLSQTAGTGTFLAEGGTLPPGLAINPSGMITGTPTQAGSFAFDFKVQSGGGASALLIGRIDVASAAPEPTGPHDGDTPLPAWALALLGGALLSAIRQKSRR